jgi:p24 family protein alpha
MRSLLSLLPLSGLLIPVQSLYFYIEGTTPKCFYEELPKDTLVVGDYSAEEFNSDQNSYVKSDWLNIYIAVDVRLHRLRFLLHPLSKTPTDVADINLSLQEVFDNDHRVVSQKGASSGRFTFTAADAGDHKICFTPSHSTGQTGWLGGQALGGVKLTLDLAIGETSAIESEDKGKIQDIVQKVRDLNGRLQDIRREQVFQRVSILILSYLLTEHLEMLESSKIRVNEVS